MVTWFYKWLLIFMLPAGLHINQEIWGTGNLPGLPAKEFHPLHVSVTEINHNASEKTLEISCKLFTDDFEKVLAQNYNTKVDLINPTDRQAMEKLVSDFITRHLQLKNNGKPVAFSFIGYEKENDAVYSYFQADNIASVKKLEITNNILYELFTDQMNLMHVIVDGKRKSMKLDYPGKQAIFNF
ncbi:MAG: DUF6702 family protein [Chitinophagaceae bacterium]